MAGTSKNWASWSPDKDIPDLHGKVLLATGGTAGLGLGSVEALAAHNPRCIYFTGRNETKGRDIAERMQREHPSVKTKFITCDMAQLSSVQAAAKQLLAELDRLDVLMNNAGVMALPPTISEDGYAIEFQTNYLGPALLTKLLLPLLEKTAASLPDADVRIVNLTSIAALWAPYGGIDFDTLETAQTGLGYWITREFTRYGQSKLANSMHASALAKRYPNITSVSIHPGFVFTDIITTSPWKTLLPIVLNTTINPSLKIPVEKGAWGQIWCATIPKEELVNGGYYEVVGQLGKQGHGLKDADAIADKLWDWTEDALKDWK